MDNENQDQHDPKTELEAPIKTYDLSNTGEIISLIKDESDENEIKKHIAAHIYKLIEKHKLSSYRVILLYDTHSSISQFHSNRIYEAVSDLNKKFDILMVIVSDGGKIEPAYLISKTCKRLSKNKFVVSIPRRAKSAATLVSLGAAEIHMGLLSELGPIDPQFGGFPALGLANALEKIASLSTKFPEAAEMFAKYLTANLNIKDLGYFERINESAAQYAQRLLDGKTFPDGKTAESLADHLTNHYKDHSFVIDADEASRLLGKNIVKEGTKEYELGNDLYSFLELTDFLFDVFNKKTMRYVGSINNGLVLSNKEAM
jgi:ClpP class serine protease